MPDLIDALLFVGFVGLFVITVLWCAVFFTSFLQWWRGQ